MRADAKTWLVTGVLRAVERSAAYRLFIDWPKPVIVRWDTAWALDPVPEDAARHHARLAAAQWLVRTGAGTVTYDKPPFDDRPRTVRCIQAQFAVLVDLARSQGVTPLADAMHTLRDAWRSMQSLATESAPSWWTTYEARLGAALEGPAPAGIGMSLDRLVDEWPLWLDSVRAARGIASGVTGYERVVSERLLGQSKRLATMRHPVAAHLRAADPQWAGRGNIHPASVLGAYGVRRIPPMLDVAGPLIVDADGSRVDVSRIEGLARCPGAWADAIGDGARAAGIQMVTTIENETSAWSYVEECGGGAGLAARRELVFYTSGFAAGVGADAVAALARQLPAAEFRHWGDADEYGIRIWLDLVRRTGAPLRWWRTTARWVVHANARGAGKRLTELERQSLRALVTDLRTDSSRDPDGAALRCAEALLHTGIKVEQEAFEPATDRAFAEAASQPDETCRFWGPGTSNVQ